ncbi:carbohydrate kinase [uncultured Pseudoflavonifractor sp.]|uniref:carbohydrate kinase family protein n=1 Tax=uncultured Pseudoflavonifractor sp. TaxID=1221379 RepID=UPI0025E60A12|nr:carbohydrate kinase [uncultured Pseudoflavonifractor sp.]
MKRYDVAVLGEALIDFTDYGVSDGGGRLFEQNPGGAPANVACAVSRLGGRAAFLGKVGDDMHGRFLRDTLAGEGVDVSGMVLDPSVFTTLAFVALDDSGERSFSFARKPGADTCLRREEVSKNVLEHCGILHVGSLSLTDEPARSATLWAVKQVRSRGGAVAYDPNYRASLWRNEENARLQMRSLTPLADYIKISDEETELLTSHNSPEEAAQTLLEQGACCVAVTLGAEGALIAARDGMKVVPGCPVEWVADTTGAGDAFWGAFLAQTAGSGLSPQEMTLEKAAEFARFANMAASLCIGRRGAIPAMPTLAEVESRLRK